MSTADWDRAYEEAPKRRDRWVTMSFEELPATGFPPDGGDAPDRIGEPGSFPYTRGIHATGYRGRPWTIRQFAGFAGVTETNARFRHLLAEGQHGVSVAFEHVLHGGERVSVYPVFERLDIAPVVRLRPSPLRETRFVLDTHLGRLARHLRLAGFDSLWENDYRDEEIVALSLAQKRVILTRDKGILMRRAVQHGHFVHETESEKQLCEVVRAFQLERTPAPFSRCRLCNAALREVAKDSVRGRVPEAVWKRLDAFTECPQCGRIFWRGTHYERLCRVLRAAGMGSAIGSA